jgi:protocatechuate 3,4-dioxygenase beta subunit
MSTKTTIKRIALVAVSALGFGMMSVVPSEATARTASSIVVGTIPASRVGVTTYVPVKVYLPAAAVATDTITINAEITAAPIMGGSANAASALNAGGTTTGNDSGALFALTDTTDAVTFASTSEDHGRMGATRSNGVANYASDSNNHTGVAASTAPSYAITAADVAAGYISFNVAITPDVAGTYTALVSTNAGTTTYYTAGDASATFSLTTGVAPTGVVLTNLAPSTTLIGGSTYGTPVAVSLVGGTLAGIETINLSTSGDGTISLDASSYATTQALTASNFTNGKKVVWLKSTGTTAQTITLTATGSAGIPSTVTATASYAAVASTGSATAVSWEAPSSTSEYTMTNATISSTTISVTELTSSQAVGVTFADFDGTKYGYLTVTDTAGTITGVAGLVYDQVWSVADGDVGHAFSFAAKGTGLAAGTTLFQVTLPAASTSTLGLSSSSSRTFATAARTNSTFSIAPNSNAVFRAAPGAAIALTATLKDQFGVARAGQTVTITTSGRNNPAATTAVTDASGKVTFTTADASTSTTSLTDTVTFSASGATSKDVTINYTTADIGTVTVTGGNTTASVTAATNTTNAISAGDGAEAGAISVTATVKDALGNGLAGVPVTFTVEGTGVAFKSTSATVYTGATGTATGSLYAWVAGTYTYTVKAGTKSTTGTATFGSTTATNARVVSATVSGNVVTGKVVDRFGNPVSGVHLYATTDKSANIGGVFLSDVQTGTDGTASWVISGTGTVTVSAVNPTSASGTTFGQTCALAGNLTCAVPGTAAEAFTASTVGTATTAETYVGASFAPAGVASATVDVTGLTSADSVDAANEATDAANAATDAANAAAEAADAATAAAQDAQAAVAALATSVASLIAGIKAQITTLTNLVIKIQKKVRA